MAVHDWSRCVNKDSEISYCYRNSVNVFSDVNVPEYNYVILTFIHLLEIVYIYIIHELYDIYIYIY